MEPTPAAIAARETIRAAILSVASNTLLTSTKLLVGLLTGSVSVVAEGIHSGNDLVASLIAWFAVRKASEPPDAEHGYGHGKFESLSAFIEAALIVVAALGVAWTAVHRLQSGVEPELKTPWGLAVMGLSVAANAFISTYLFRVAKKHQSLALAADGAHLRADVYTSLGVFAGLILITVTGRLIFDPLAAILVACLILFQGSRIGWDALGQLLDQSLPPDERHVIEGLLGEHDDMYVDYHRLRTRRSGRERQVDLHLVTCPRVTVEEAHRVCDHLERDVGERLPQTRLVIHVEPCDEESCPNRAANERDPSACRLMQSRASATPPRK
jgi:cation diffusion facilitator family transporter